MRHTGTVVLLWSGTSLLTGWEGRMTSVFVGVFGERRWATLQRTLKAAISHDIVAGL